MTSNTQAASPVPEAATLSRALAAVSDWDALCAVLERALPSALPATRLDIYTQDGAGRLHMRFSTAPTHGSPPLADSEIQLRFHLQRQGFGAIMLVQLVAFGAPAGWLALARVQGMLAPAAQSLAEQIAPVIALWLRCEERGTQVDAIAAREALLEQRVRSTEKLRLRAILAAGAAHDIGNLFTTVMGYTQLLQQDLPALYQNDVAMIMRAVEDGRQLLRRLQSGELSVQGIGVATPVAQLVEDSVRLTRPLWERRAGVSIETLVEDTPSVRVPAEDLREVLVNLIVNAVASVSEGGAITVRCGTRDRHVVIAVADSGRGIARELHGAIFQPFVTTRAGSSGLGLSVSRALIEHYGGTLLVESEVGHGATFTIALPVAQ